MIKQAREENPDHDIAQDEVSEIQRVVEYSQNAVDCRRVQVLRYFDEHFDPTLCHAQCDNCRNAGDVTLVTTDVTDTAKNLVRLAKEDIRNTQLHFFFPM